METRARGPDKHAFQAICAEAVVCDVCFSCLGVSRAFIDIPQPRYVGPAYWTAKERRVFLMINPGAGKSSPSDQAMRREIVAYRDGTLTLEDLYHRQRERFAEWGRNGKFLKFLQNLTKSLDDVALLNVAWCATQGDRYPKAMLEACWVKHTQRALEALCPTNLVACGREAQAFARSAKLKFVTAPHYAARIAIDFDEVRSAFRHWVKEFGEIALEAAADALSQASYSKAGGRVARTSDRSDQDVIHLLVAANPKKPASASFQRFACYRDGMTIAEYKTKVERRLGAAEAAKCRADLLWDEQRHFIRIEPQ